MIAQPLRWLSLPLILLLLACGTPAAQTPAQPSTPTAMTGQAGQVDLNGIKQYLVESSQSLKAQTAALDDAGTRYYELAKAADFDYAALWQQQSSEVSTTLAAAKAAWTAASPGYERIEGIVAGVPSLAEYDVILDAGTAGSEDPEGAVPFDLTLPNGQVLPKPGNLFGLTESTLWGTRAEWVAPNVVADFNADGKQDFGEVLPDANMLKGASAEMDRYTAELQQAAGAWQPTETDAFTALVVMIPTMSEYFESWKNSRFVAGAESTQSDFGVISRLADVQDILGGLQVVYRSVSPKVTTVDPGEAQRIAQGLDDLKNFVAKVFTQEQAGKRFTPEEADTLGGEAQTRATALAGQISQVAARLNIMIEQ